MYCNPKKSIQRKNAKGSSFSWRDEQQKNILLKQYTTDEDWKKDRHHILVWKKVYISGQYWDSDYKLKNGLIKKHFDSHECKTMEESCNIDEMYTFCEKHGIQYDDDTSPHGSP